MLNKIKMVFNFYCCVVIFAWCTHLLNGIDDFVTIAAIVQNYENSSRETVNITYGSSKVLRINEGATIELVCQAAYTDGYFLRLWYTKRCLIENTTTNELSISLDSFISSGITSNNSDILAIYPVDENKNLNFTFIANILDDSTTFVCLALKTPVTGILSYDYVQLIVSPKESAMKLYDRNMINPTPPNVSYFKTGDEMAFLCNTNTRMIFPLWIRMKDGNFTQVHSWRFRLVPSAFLSIRPQSSDSNAIYYCIAYLYSNSPNCEIVQRKVSYKVYLVSVDTPPSIAMPISKNVNIHILVLSFVLVLSNLQGDVINVMNFELYNGTF